MIDLKIIILLIGIFLFTVGFINQYRPDIDKQIIYNIVPRDVYDDIFFSLPLVQYDKEFNELVNPQYILNDPGNYNSLYLNSKKLSKYDYDLEKSDINRSHDLSGLTKERCESETDLNGNVINQIGDWNEEENRCNIKYITKKSEGDFTTKKKWDKYKRTFLDNRDTVTTN